MFWSRLILFTFQLTLLSSILNLFKYNSGSIPVILGRPFLATSNALINYRNGMMKISSGTMTMELNIFNIGNQIHEHDNFGEVNMIDTLVQKHFLQSSIEDPLEGCLAHFGSDFDIDHSIEEVNSLLNSTPLMSVDKWQPKVLPLTLSSSPPHSLLL